MLAFTRLYAASPLPPWAPPPPPETEVAADEEAPADPPPETDVATEEEAPAEEAAPEAAGASADAVPSGKGGQAGKGDALAPAMPKGPARFPGEVAEAAYEVKPAISLGGDRKGLQIPSQNSPQFETRKLPRNNLGFKPETQDFKILGTSQFNTG